VRRAPVRALAWACLLVALAGTPARAATLLLRTDPPGARVRLDTREVGRSDPRGLLSLANLAAGPHLVQVTADGYRTVTVVVEIGDATVAQGVVLQPVPGASVEGAEVVEGRAGGEEQGEDEEQGEATPRLATLVVDAQAPGIVLRLDGAPAGTTDRAGTLTLEGVGAGQREVRASFRGTVFANTAVVLAPGRVTTVRIKPPRDAVVPPGLPMALNAAVTVLGLFILGSLVYLGQRWRRMRRGPAVEKRQPRAEADAPAATLATPFPGTDVRELEGRALNALYRAERLVETCESTAVFTGRLAQTGMPVRVEVFLPALSDNPDTAAMLLDDLRLAVDIVHPNHLRVLDRSRARWPSTASPWTSWATASTRSPSRWRRGPPSPSTSRATRGGRPRSPRPTSGRSWP
jgi:hypothetical protein